MSMDAHSPSRGIFWMVVTGLCFVVVTALVKLNGTRIPAAEAAFLRYLLGLVFLVPAILRLQLGAMSSKVLMQFGLRGAAHTLAVILWFFAMARISLSEVTAMNYLTPIYVTIGAALFLGERLALRRILAVMTALLGALIILRPGFRELGAGHIAMLLAAALFSVSYLTAKLVTDKVGPVVVVAMLSVTVTVGLAPFAFAVWVTPTLHELALLFGVAAFATAGHFTMTLAFAAAPLTVTQPVTFLQLIWAVALGYFGFQESIDVWVVVGGCVILGSVTFITWREAVLKKRGLTPLVHAPKV